MAMRVFPFAFTILVSAFLLFIVQPLMGRFILPWFGGSAGVWSVAMLFFQTVLLAGYAYAHLLNRLAPRAQALIHIAVLAACALVLPVIPGEGLKPAPGDEPVLRILLLLAATVGLPFFALSTTGPLVQAWFARRLPGRSPYPLYALSNVGSLAALLAYPFLIEPWIGRQAQAVGWSWGFGLFALACGAVAVLSMRGEGAKPAPAPASPISRGLIARWIALPAVASALLLAFTNEMCIDVASVPFLWVLPLSLYLLSFIVTFAGADGPPRIVWYPMAALAMVATVALHWGHTGVPIQLVILGYAAALLILCIVLHGEAYRLRPEPARLTLFYLCVSLGGVLGGLFVAVLAPLIFPLYAEVDLALTAAAILLLLALWDAGRQAGTLPALRNALAGMALLVSLLIGNSILAWAQEGAGALLLSRNFYGTYVVTEYPATQEHDWSRQLRSGTTLHGFQFMDHGARHLPTTYYAWHSGVGIAVETLPEAPRRIGVVGLGAGTMAAYGREGDVVRFYEINPRCPEIAREYFTYLRDTRASVEIALGDARLSLEAEPPQRFDLLALDAFTSDSIPVHLLTLEAFEVYLRHLAPGGVLCVHISNRHLELEPVMHAAASRLGLHALGWSATEAGTVGADNSSWVMFTREAGYDRVFLARAKRVLAGENPGRVDLEGLGEVFALDTGAELPPWTDDYSNLFRVLK